MQRWKSKTISNTKAIYQLGAQDLIKSPIVHKQDIDKQANRISSQDWHL